MEGKKMFKKFLHDETAIIGLKSLGLSTTKQPTSSFKQNSQNLNIFPIDKKTLNSEKTVNLNFTAKQPKTLDELFGRSLKLNLK